MHYLTLFTTLYLTPPSPISSLPLQDVKLCQTNTYHYVHPRAARNTDGRFVFTVNGTEALGDFVQLVEVVECLEAGTECGVGEMMGSQRTRCQQSYRHHRMVALVEGRLVRDTFLVPSGCFCQLLGVTKNLTAMCKDGADFCEDPEDYPLDQVSKVIVKKRTMREIQPHSPRQVGLKYYSLLYNLSLSSGQALHDTTVQDPVCPMTQYFTQPRAARNNKGKIMFILNMGGEERHQEYVQEVQVGECLAAGQSCGDGHLFRHTTTFCKQQYSNITLWAMTEEFEVVVDTFTFPTSCACWVRGPYDV